MVFVWFLSCILFHDCIKSVVAQLPVIEKTGPEETVEFITSVEKIFIGSFAWKNCQAYVNGLAGSMLST